jgi:hypothetical protein
MVSRRGVHPTPTIIAIADQSSMVSRRGVHPTPTIIAIADQPIATVINEWEMSGITTKRFEFGIAYPTIPQCLIART